MDSLPATFLHFGKTGSFSQFASPNPHVGSPTTRTAQNALSTYWPTFQLYLPLAEALNRINQNRSQKITASGIDLGENEQDKILASVSHQLVAQLLYFLKSITWKNDKNEIFTRVNATNTSSVRAYASSLVPLSPVFQREDAYLLGWIPIFIKFYQLIGQIFACFSAGSHNNTNKTESSAPDERAATRTPSSVQNEIDSNFDSNEWETISLWIYLGSLSSEGFADMKIKAKDAQKKYSTTLPFRLSISFRLGCWTKHTLEGGSKFPLPIQSNSTTGELTLLVDPEMLAFGCECHGRYDTYLLAVLLLAFKALQSDATLFSTVLHIPGIFLHSLEMIENRAHHAFRVFHDAMNVSRITETRYEWYLTLLTEGSFDAAQDTLKDLDSDVWYSQFNKYDTSSRKRLEKLLVALLGHSAQFVRNHAVALLNCFYDNHCWQKEAIFEPLIRTVKDPFSVKILVMDETLKITPTNLFLVVSSPSMSLNVSHEIYSFHSFQWSSFVHEGKNCWLGSFNFGFFEKCGFYDWRIVQANIEDGTWLPLRKNALLECFINLHFISENQVLRREAKFLEERRIHSGDLLQGRFIVQPSNIRDQQIHEIFIDQHAAQWEAKTGELTQRGSFAAVKESLEGLRQNGVSTVYLMGALARDNGNFLYTSHGDLSYERPDASPFAVTCRATPNAMLGGIEGFMDLIREARRNSVNVNFYK